MTDPENTYQKIVEQMREGVVTLTSDGRISYSNYRFTDLIERSLERTYGEPFARFVAEQDRERFEDLIHISQGGYACGELTLCAAGGGEIPVQVSLSSVVLEGQSCTCMIVTDLTERRRADLAQLAAELSQAEHRERRRLAGLLHDDLQQLLLAVRLRLPTLVRAPQERIEENLKKVEEILEACVNTSRDLTLELSPPVLYAGTLADVVHWLGRWFGEKHGLAVLVDVLETLPPTPEYLRAFLFQAVRELLTNVVKHSGKMEAQVILSCHGADFSIEVKDCGKGFDPAVLEISLKRPESFGLFSIRQRLDALGGHLEIHSAPGGGATFQMILPIADPAKSAGKQSAQPSRNWQP